MTTERDFDRLARAWLDVGPNEAPDRVVAAVLQAAETTPQVRRPIGRSIRRSFHMNRLSIAAIAVVLVAVVGGGLLYVRNTDQGAGAPTATPNASPAPSASAARVPVPEALRATWVADVEPIAGLGNTDSRLQFIVSPVGSTIWVVTNEFGNETLFSITTEVTADEMVIETIKDGVSCTVGDQGRYHWSLSDDGVSLELSAVDDACATRSTTLARTWVRGFDGTTAGGRAAATAFEPALLATLPNAHFTGNIGPDAMVIESSELGRTLMAVKDPWGSTDPCATDGGAKKPIDPGVDAFVAYMRTLPGAEVTATDLQIDGHRAARLTVPFSDSIDCPNGQIDEWTTKNPKNDGWWFIQPGDTDVIYVVELPDATYLLQYLGDGVTADEEGQVMSSIQFLDRLGT